jgi:hypothetical protein
MNGKVSSNMATARMIPGSLGDELTAHQTCLSALTNLGSLARLTNSAKSVGIDLRTPGGFAALEKLHRMAAATNSPALNIPLPPLAGAGMPPIGRLGVLSGLLASIKRSLGISPLAINAGTVIPSKLQKIGTLGIGSSLPSPLLASPHLPQLLQLSSATAALREAGISVFSPQGAAGLQSFLADMQKNGGLKMLGQPGLGMPLAPGFGRLGAFAATLRSIANPEGLGVSLLTGAAMRQLPLLARGLTAGSMSPLLGSITTGQLPGGMMLPSVSQLGIFNHALARAQLLKMGTGVDLADPNAEKKLLELLRSLHAGGTCRALGSVPVGASQLAGAAKLQSVLHGSESVAAGLNMNLATEKNAAGKLGRAIGDFRSHGQPAAGTDLNLDQIFPAVSRLAQAAKATEHTSSFR